MMSVFNSMAEDNGSCGEHNMNLVTMKRKINRGFQSSWHL